MMLKQTDFTKESPPVSPQGILRAWGCLYMQLQSIKTRLGYSESYKTKEGMINAYHADLAVGYIKKDCTVQDSSKVLGNGLRVTWFSPFEYAQYRDSAGDSISLVKGAIAEYQLQSPELKASQQQTHFVEIDPESLKVINDTASSSPEHSRHVQEGKLISIRVVR
jgi:hypothetical protein